MNLSTECLEAAQVELLLQGNLTPHEYATSQEHLEVCEHCRARVEETIGPEQWWGDVQSVLLNSQSALFPKGQASSADAEPNDTPTKKLLDMLGPTDDPNMLGRIGPYEIIGLLGQGGMGAVFKGFDRSLNRFVAIKMLLPHLAASGAARKRFAREGQAVAAVVDDHVMAIHCVDEWQGIPYLVMTYSRGASLQKRLNDNGQLEVREILRIGMQAAKGLAAAHAQGIVHRDIKPANIFLDQNVERVQLMDFGLARAVDDASLTRSGTLAGTPQYMSPEQARAETVDHRSDLFSLGSVLYTMCTGHAPFRAESSYSVLRLITDKEPRPIREVNPDIPEWLCATICKLMSKQADDRFSSAAQVAEILEECLGHVQQPTSVPLPASLVPHDGRRSIFNVTRKGMIAMLVTIVVMLIGGVLQQQLPDAHNSTDKPRTSAISDHEYKTPVAQDLLFEARKALHACQESLKWMEKFDMHVTRQEVKPEYGKIVDEDRIRREAPRMVKSGTHIFVDKPNNFGGNTMNWAMDDGEMFIGRTTNFGQKKLTGRVTVKDRLNAHWRMFQTWPGFAMEGHAAGNRGRTLMELLLEAKQPDVRMEKIGNHDCLRISDRNDWGTMTVWIEAGPSRRLCQWESRKERGNRSDDGRFGEDKNTANWESNSSLVEDIKYETIDGIEIAVSCRVRRTSIANGGTKHEYTAEYKRTDINLRPDFSVDNPFVGDFDNGARITDGDSYEYGAAFRWQDGKLTRWQDEKLTK